MLVQINIVAVHNVVKYSRQASLADVKARNAQHNNQSLESRQLGRGGGGRQGAGLVCFSLSEITSFMGIRDYSALQRLAARQYRLENNLALPLVFYIIPTIAFYQIVSTFTLHLSFFYQALDLMTMFPLSLRFVNEVFLSKRKGGSFRTSTISPARVYTQTVIYARYYKTRIW